MKIWWIFSLLLILYCMFTPVALFSETTILNNAFYLDFYSKQTYINYSSCLNPDNIYKRPDGYFGTEVFKGGYKCASEKIAFTFNDFGEFKADKDPELVNHISEMYFSLPIKIGFIDFGKKRINQSLSYFKSPINFALDQNNEYNLQFSEGRVMANADLFTDYGFIGLSYMPRIDFTGDVKQYVSSPQKEQYLFRYDLTILKCETGIAVSKGDFFRIGTHVSRALGDYFEMHVEYVFNEEKDYSKFNFESGLATNTSIQRNYCSEALLGITANLDIGTGIFEYYYNQSGNSPDEWSRIQNSYKEIRNASPSPFYDYNLGTAFQSLYTNADSTNGQHYFMVRLSNPTADNYQLAVNTIINLQDLSGIVMPSFRYDGWNNISLEAKFAASFGNEYAEFMLFGEIWSCGLDAEIWL